MQYFIALTLTVILSKMLPTVVRPVTDTQCHPSDVFTSPPRCYRPSDVIRILEGTEEEAKRQLLYWSPFNHEFASTRGICLPLSSLSKTKHPKDFLKRIFEDAIDLNISSLTLSNELLRASCAYFRIHFRDFVREVLELSPQSLQLFQEQYETLSTSLYGFLLNHQDGTCLVKQVMMVCLLSQFYKRTLSLTFFEYHRIYRKIMPTHLLSLHLTMRFETPRG